MKKLCWKGALLPPSTEETRLSVRSDRPGYLPHSASHTGILKKQDKQQGGVRGHAVSLRPSSPPPQARAAAPSGEFTLSHQAERMHSLPDTIGAVRTAA